jgi:hypothetical protein
MLFNFSLPKMNNKQKLMFIPSASVEVSPMFAACAIVRQ